MANRVAEPTSEVKTDESGVCPQFFPEANAIVLNQEGFTIPALSAVLLTPDFLLPSGCVQPGP